MKKTFKKARKYDVSFEIETKSLSLDALSKKIGIIPSSGSKNKGHFNKIGKLRRVSPITYFRLFSVLPANAKLEKHLDLIVKKVDKSTVFKRGALPKDSRLSISIAEYWHTKGYAFPHVWIPCKYLLWCGKHKINIDFVAYPCSN